MSTLIYTPAIRVHIQSATKGTLDISDDIAVWNLHRASNAVSTFNFTLQNTQRKYDGVFKPGDRLTVQLKRITWVPVFTGSLNSVPIFSVWPRALPMSASCSLKKLQFWPWDPTTTASSALIQSFYQNGQVTATSTAGDGGLSGLIKTSLEKVTGWSPNAIHIGQVPNDWFAWLKTTEQAINVASTMAAVLGPPVVGGVTANGSALNPGAGTYGGQSLNAAQTGVAGQIYAAVISNSGLTSPQDQDRVAVLCMMCVRQESVFNPTAVGPDGSLGLFQQIPAWGTSAEREDVTWTTTAFMKGANGNPGLFTAVPGWRTGDPGSIVQAVQKSAFPGAYSQWEPMAVELVAKMRALFTNALNPSTLPNGTAPTTGLPSGSLPTTSSGTNIAQVGYDLVKQHPAIKYDQATRNLPSVTIPTILDCSSLVAWVYFHATGHFLPNSGADGGGATAASIQAESTSIPLAIAEKVQGAALFNGTPAEHVAVSLGDGTCSSAHQWGVLADVSADGGQFNNAGLLPGIDYTHAATDTATAAYLQGVLKKPCTVSTFQINSSGVTNDPSITSAGSTTQSVFSQIVTVLASAPQTNGDIFGGPRELINNSPFLPWLKNLTNSSMRAFCSAPNGDFIAWFPDYFGIWGTAAIMNVEPIELQDFTVEWSDQQIVTHEFVIGTNNPVFDPTTGLVGAGAADTYQGLTAMLTTQGVATMDFPQLFTAIYGKQGISKAFIQDYLARFGARPNVDQMGNVFAGQGEFFMAVWNFMFYWAAQFSAEVPMTFMPELYPGMLLRIPAFGFQAYVTDVVHQGAYGENGGFTTQATIIAPASLAANPAGGVTVNPSLFNLLPTGGTQVGAS